MLYQHLQNDPFSKDPSMQSGVDSLLEFWKHHLLGEFSALSSCSIEQKSKWKKNQLNKMWKVY